MGSVGDSGSVGIVGVWGDGRVQWGKRNRGGGGGKYPGTTISMYVHQ